MKLPIAQSDREKALRIVSAELLASLPKESLDREIKIIRVGAEFPERMIVRDCLDAMRKYPHMEYRLAAAGEKFVIGTDEDSQEIAGEWVPGKPVVEALSKSEAVA